MTYDEWEATVPAEVRSDATWKVEVYRLGLYLGALAWRDAERLLGDPRGALVAGQLMRSAASIAANVAEGYGRRSPKERVRFYEYSLGSAGETRAWYVTIVELLGKSIVEARLATLLSATRLLLTMIRREREKRADWMETRVEE
ncbi:MAG TPA: four helix bundle protein [Gemmatimonadaceae bacterium]